MKKLTGTFVVVAVAIVTAIVQAQSQPAFPAVTINYQDFSVDEKGVETPGTRLLARIKSDGSRSTQNFDRDRITPTFREVLDLGTKKYFTVDDFAKVIGDAVATNRQKALATGPPCSKGGCPAAGKILGYDVVSPSLPSTGGSVVSYIAPSLGFQTLRIEWKIGDKVTSYRQATYVTMGADDSAFSYPADYESSDPLNFILKSDAARGRVTDQRTIEAGKRANQNVEKARADAIK